MKSVVVPEQWSDCLAIVLRDLRIANKLTQQDVANALGKSRTSVTNKELGRQEFTLLDVLSLCSLFNVTTDSLISSVDSKAKEHGFSRH